MLSNLCILCIYRLYALLLGNCRQKNIDMPGVGSGLPFGRREYQRTTVPTSGPIFRPCSQLCTSFMELHPSPLRRNSGNWNGSMTYRQHARSMVAFAESLRKTLWFFRNYVFRQQALFYVYTTLQKSQDILWKSLHTYIHTYIHCEIGQNCKPESQLHAPCNVFQPFTKDLRSPMTVMLHCPQRKSAARQLL